MSDMVEKATNFVSEKVASIKKPEATLADVDFKSITRDSATFSAQVSVNNPYPCPLPICEVTYLLKSDNRVIASGTMPDPGSLAANQTTMLDVPVQVPYSILISLAKDISSDWDIDYALELGFTIDLPVVGNFTLPLSHKGEIKLPTLGDIL
ncbi:PREDICTED: desiccation protectant protein Lea14 homolog [Nelumbo nucifera]|uniref:Desiccation protectant protein Lea14 homolog n=1 Tax=Nelumbo nucifera TaxID=4432 RepID=A0A1U7YTK1_NELNU|nr:PREDICTED: desiccation protectant protein Lea14 homolog [Nelumbo nucifera]